MSSAALPELRGDGTVSYIVRGYTKEMSQRLARSLLVGIEPREAAVLGNTLGEDRLVYVSSHHNESLNFQGECRRHDRGHECTWEVVAIQELPVFASVNTRPPVPATGLKMRGSEPFCSAREERCSLFQDTFSTISF